MKIFFAESEWWEPFSEEFQEKFEKVITEAHAEASKLLQHVPEHTNYFVQLAPWSTIPEKGMGARTESSRLIIFSLDQGLPHGEESLMQCARETVFHELNHSSRFEAGFIHGRFIDGCVMEGLATRFEHEKAGADPLWGKYDTDEARLWFDEIRELGNNIDYGQYMYTHSDGRRWIGYKVGTWIVDEAIKKSGRDIIDLTCNASSDEIIKLAQV